LCAGAWSALLVRDWLFLFSCLQLLRQGKQMRTNLLDEEDHMLDEALLVEGTALRSLISLLMSNEFFCAMDPDPAQEVRFTCLNVVVVLCDGDRRCVGPSQAAAHNVHTFFFMLSRL
jgi:hypothetical protein